jgi:hypothetical protein
MWAKIAKLNFDEKKKKKRYDAEQKVGVSKGVLRFFILNIIF